MLKGRNLSPAFVHVSLSLAVAKTHRYFKRLFVVVNRMYGDNTHRICKYAFCLFLLQLAEAQDPTPAKTCSAPEAPKNAIAVGNNTIGSTVKFLCKEGFFRLGRPFTSTCRSDGQWTKPYVSCVAVSCGDPGSPVNGKREGWLFQFGNTVNFTCSPGYKLEGPKTRTCLANQTWSKTQPICKRITCEDPPTVANAEMFGGGFVFEAHVHYTCREGYKMQGAADLACGEQGKWIGEVPVCTGKFQLYIRTSILVLSSLKVLFLQNACGFQVSSHESMQKTNNIRY